MNSLFQTRVLPQLHGDLHGDLDFQVLPVDDFFALLLLNGSNSVF